MNGSKCWICGRSVIGASVFICSAQDPEHVEGRVLDRAASSLHIYERRIMTEEIPNAYVTNTRVDPNSGVRSVEVKCPYCGGMHTHGWSLTDQGDPGHRVSHCQEQRPNHGYNIVFEAGSLVLS